jgi:anaerobic magnesium-protoporphyrin IX monomethyl ester cyclase
MRVRRVLTHSVSSEEAISTVANPEESLQCDILLIQPPIRDYYLTTKRTIPYGLLSIAAALRQNGYKVVVLDSLANGKSRPAPLPRPLEYLSGVYGPPDTSPFALFHQYRHFGYALPTIAERARLSGAFLIGISSLFSAYEDMALECAQAVKSMAPESLLVLGGHHPSVFPDRILDHPAVDFVLRGDGEATLPTLANTLQQKGALESVPGIAFDREDGQRHINPPAYVDELDGLAPPAIDLVNTRYYARNGKATLTMASSRGCPMQCSYCCMGAHSSIPYRRRSVKHVMQEILHAAAHREIGFIDFEDENMAMDHAWFRDLLNEIIHYFDTRTPELRAMNGLYPPALNKTTIALMQDAGFRELNLSLGSCDGDQVRRFQRPPVVSAFDRALTWAEQRNMTAVGYLIAGAPGQDPMASVADLLYLASRRVLVGLSIYYPAPDSTDFKQCKAAGLLPSSPLGWRSTALPLDHTTGRTESTTLLRLARILNFMKHCLDEDGCIPSPEAFAHTTHHVPGNRSEIGRQLLRWFLKDGIFRGVSKNGEIMVHPTAMPLSQVFLKGLQTISIRGVRR